MGSIVGTIFAFLIVFGILVFVHEFGHFFMAKLVGIRVEVFSFGYGKRLFGIKKGDTDYRISLVPMGGFVKFAGEEAALEGLKPTSEPKPGDYLSAKRWQRFLVILMGPIMNIVLAIVLIAAINMTAVTVPAYQEEAPVIGWIQPGSPAETSNLRVDDLILAVNDSSTPTWNEVLTAVGTRPDREIRILIRRGDREFEVDLKTELQGSSQIEYGYAGFYGKILTQVQAVNLNSPAEQAGLEAGDVLLNVNGEPAFYFKFVELIESNPDVPLDFQVEREGRTVDLTVTPRREGDIGKIGILHGPKSIIKKYGFFKAFGESFRENIRLLGALVTFLKELFAGEASTRQLGGPIEIANLSYTFFRMGFMAMISWIAFISLQLGVVNLVPVPVFDGGQILVLTLEGIFRKDFSLRVKQVIMQIGFAMFIALLVFIVLNDVVKRLPNGWNSLIPF